MKKNRQIFDDNTNIILINEVNGLCPLCAEPLMYIKGNRNYRGYEIAHIYPVNPKPPEVELLAFEERLNSDVNHRDNLIPLCRSCHGKFDKPRTTDEYRELVAIKKSYISQTKERETWHVFDIESNIHDIIDHLVSMDMEESDCELQYEPKTIDEKTDKSISRITKDKIKFHVNNYFSYVKKELEIADSLNPGSSEIIAGQIKQFYLKQKQKGLSQQEIYSNTVNWMTSKSQENQKDGCEVIVSFFVQNCEVFS